LTCDGEAQVGRGRPRSGGREIRWRTRKNIGELLGAAKTKVP